MTKYLAGVLTVIAAGVLLVAYGLLAPRAAASPGYQEAWSPSGASGLVLQPGLVAVPRATQASQVIGWEPAYAPVAIAQPSYAPVATAKPAVLRETVTQAPRARRTVAAAPKRNWKKTAMVVGGSAAGGAGVGALIGGKKGALVGAAIGGGAGTLYEVLKK